MGIYPWEAAMMSLIIHHLIIKNTHLTNRQVQDQTKTSAIKGYNKYLRKPIIHLSMGL
jgi:hypothetical protein